MEKPIVGQPLPALICIATSGKTINLQEFKNQNVVLYFYPKDNTPGCTVEGQDFRDKHSEFATQNTVIFGISRDKLASHEKFKCAQNFPFELISDPEEQLCQFFGVMKDKNMYGKKVRGIERSTFIIDKQGILCKEWRNVKVPGHVDEVLNFVKTLSS